MAATPFEIVILLSVGSFQAAAPGVAKEPSPVFEDSAAGLRSFTAWAKATLGEPKFAQPPSRLCVVGAVPFSGAGPYIPRPIWESQRPVRELEPYAATFHYVEPPAASAPPAKPRTMKQALAICAKAAKEPLPVRPATPVAPAPAQAPRAPR